MRALRYRWLRRLLVLACLATGIVRPAVDARGDYDVFVRGGERLLSGAWLTVFEPHHFTYPPLFAVVMLPLQFVPRLPGEILWAALNALLLVACLRIIARLILLVPAFSAIPELPGDAPGERVTTLSFVLAFQAVLAVFQNQQFDLLVFFVALLGVAALLGEHDVAGGFWLGLAAALKCTPLLFLPYLVLKRHVRAALAFSLSVGLLSIVPDLFFRAPGHGLYLFDWLAKIVVHVPAFDRWIDPQFSGSLAPGGGTNELNQALGIWIHRVFAAASDSPIHLFSLSSEAEAWVRRLAYLLLVLPLAWLPRARLGFRDTGRALLTFEMALIFPLMLLLSPMSSKPHFTALLLPLALVVAGARDYPVVWRRLGFALLFAFSVLSGRDVVGESAAMFLYHLGVFTWLTVLVYALTIAGARRSAYLCR